MMSKCVHLYEAPPIPQFWSFSRPSDQNLEAFIWDKTRRSTLLLWLQCGNSHRHKGSTVAILYEPQLDKSSKGGSDVTIASKYDILEYSGHSMQIYAFI